PGPSRDTKRRPAQQLVVAIPRGQPPRLQHELVGASRRRGHRFPKERLVEQVADGWLLRHLIVANWRTRWTLDSPEEPCDIQTNRRSIWAWTTMKTLTRTR